MSGCHNAPPNTSLDASGDCAFFRFSRSFIVDLRRAAASTRTFDVTNMIESVSMDNSGIEEHPRPSRSELDQLTRGSIVKLIDPEKGVWYWVVIERCFGDHTFAGRIDAHCALLGPTLRHGGTVTFHEDNIFFVWPMKVEPMFDALWFRILSQVISFGAGIRAIKRPTQVVNSGIGPFVFGG